MGWRVFLLLLFLSASASAQSGIVRGKVRLPSGSTINGVIVELWRSSGLEAQVVTTRDGDFEFPGLNPASYEVVVKHQGYQPFVERAEFRYERSTSRIEVISVEVNLKPVPTAGGSDRAGTTFVQEIPPAARTAFDDGIAKLKSGRPVEGVASIREAISIFPAYFYAHVTLAGQLLQERKEADALAELELARVINDRDGRVYHLFGVLMAGQRKYATAEWAFRAAIDRDPTAFQSLFSRAVVLLELMRDESVEKKRQSHLIEAERDLTRAIELSGERYYPAYLQRARIFELRNNRKAAVRDLETYLKLNPNDKNTTAIREAITNMSQ